MTCSVGGAGAETGVERLGNTGLGDNWKIEPETLPWREPFTNREDFFSLIEERSRPSWMSFHLSWSRIASVFLS